MLTLAGFTRLEPEMPDIYGEYESDVQRAQIAIDPTWFPAVRTGVKACSCYCVQRPSGFGWSGLRSSGAWMGSRWDMSAGRGNERAIGPFPGGPYVLLHTLSHLLIQSLAMRCGYPASSLRERIYSDTLENRFGILMYTGSPDADGTLGGLVQQARHFEDHLAYALRSAELCSNDPICAQHTPGRSLENRWLHGAACHGCSLVAETSCEMRNDYLDRALVVPVLGVPDASFFRVP